VNDRLRAIVRRRFLYAGDFLITDDFCAQTIFVRGVACMTAVFSAY